MLKIVKHACKDNLAHEDTANVTVHGQSGPGNHEAAEKHEAGQAKSQELEIVDQQALTTDQLASSREKATPAAVDLSCGKKSISPRKIAANRRNSRLSTGPENTEKTRYNALKHGLLANGLTPLDDIEEFSDNLEALIDVYRPDDPIEKQFVKSAALDIARARRIDRLEADGFSLLANTRAGDSDCPIVDFTLFKEYLGPLLDRTQRYHTSISNRLLRYQHALKSKSADEAAKAESLLDDQHENAVVKKVN